MSEFLFKSYSRSTETSFFPWKSRKFENSIFFKMVDFSLFFAICILYLHFVFRVCLFVFFPFWLLVFCCWSPWSRERLISNSRVVIDHQNRHHHHQMSIRTQTRTETSLGVLHLSPFTYPCWLLLDLSWRWAFLDKRVFCSFVGLHQGLAGGESLHRPCHRVHPPLPQPWSPPPASRDLRQPSSLWARVRCPCHQPLQHNFS